MRRRIFRAVSWLRWPCAALAICAGIAAVVSGSYMADARCSLFDCSCACDMTSGTLTLYAWNEPLWYEGGFLLQRLTWDWERYKWLEFDWTWRRPISSSGTVTYLKLPLWLVAVTLAGAATAGFWTRKSLKEYPSGRCGSCGYPVTGSSVCPECGTPSTTTS